MLVNQEQDSFTHTHRDTELEKTFSVYKMLSAFAIMHILLQNKLKSNNQMCEYTLS